MFLRWAEIPREGRESSLHRSFRPEDYDEIFADDGFKHFNAFMNTIFHTSKSITNDNYAIQSMITDESFE